MDKKYFEESEWPHDLLQQFGLSREMIEDLPSPALDDLTEGRRSPMLPILMTNKEGLQIKTHARFSFFRNDNDSINVLFYPELIEADLSRFDSQQQEDQNPRKQFLHSAVSVSVPATTVCLPVRFPKHCSGQSANSARPRISPSETVL